MATPAATASESLDAAWEEACLAFRNVAGIDLKKVAVPSADDIRAKFDGKKAKDADEHRKIDKAKDVFGKTVVCIEKIGNVAAMGASMVFGSPASIAYSALSVFIDAGIQYKNIFSNIDDLLSQIVVVLERFQIYKDNQADLPPQMIRVANKLLLAVVSICGICFKTLRKNKFKTFLGVALFNSDNDVQAQLARLKALEAEESQMKGTLSLVAAESTKRTLVAGLATTNEGLGKVSGGVQRLEAEMKDQRDLEDLRKQLSIPKESAQVDEYHRYLDRVSSCNACGWLEKDALYQSWSDSQDSENDILVIAGEEGFGKSFVATAIIEDLTRRYPQRNQTVSRVSVGYFYVTKTGKSGQVASVYDVLRSFAWQIAQNDLFYRKDIIGICKKTSDLGNTQAFWQQLFLDCAEEDAAIYLVMDGIHDLETKEQDLLVEVVKALAVQPKAALRLKLLLAARSNSFVENLRAKVSGSLSIMDLAERTKGDLERHIRKEADKMTIFKKQTTKVQDLKSSVCEGLTEAVNGSFLYADYLLREISSKYDPEEVMAIVNRAKKSGNLSDSITDVIKKCNQTLSTKELQDLNTMLLWVIHGFYSFELLEMDAILFLQRGESSLKPLYSRITEEFSAFFSLSLLYKDQPYTCISLKSDTIAEYFQKISDDEKTPSADATKALSKGEIKLVRNFISKLCEADVYERLGLDAFFERKLSESDTTITVDCENAHALILIDCLRVFIGDGGDEASELHSYAAQYIFPHLQAIDLDGISPRYKAELGPLLIGLFKEAKGVAKASEWYEFIHWSYNDDIPEEFMRLMRSSAVMKKITTNGGEDNEWLTSLLDSEEPALELLEPITKFYAKRWFSGLYVMHAASSFLWLFGRYNKLRSAADPQQHPRLKESPRLEEVPASTIREVFEWTKTLPYLDVDFGAVETLRNLGVTYRLCNRLDEAIDTLNEALSVSEGNLQVLSNLAKAYGFRSDQSGSNEYDIAIGYANRIMEAAAAGTQIFDIDCEENLIGWRIEAAGWNQKAKHYQEAERLYKLVLERAPTEYGVQQMFLLMMCEQERWADIVAHCQNLSQEMDGDQSRLSVFIHKWLHNEGDSISKLNNAFKQAGELDKAKQHYQKARDDASKSQEEHTALSLYLYALVIFHWAAMLHQHSAGKDDRDHAIALWEDLLAMEGSKDALQSIKYRTSKRLSSVYLAQALEAGKNDPIASENISKIQSLGKIDSDVDDWSISKYLVRSLLGRYYSAVGDVEHSREALRPSVEVGLKLLSDDDDENDYLGFERLGEAFMDFGDIENALAAWTMIGPNQGVEQFERRQSEAVNLDEPNGNSGHAEVEQMTANGSANVGAPNGAVGPANVGEDEAETSNGGDSGDEPPSRPTLKRSNTSQLEKKLAGPLTNSCDGRCGREWTWADDMYHCRVCTDVQFCEPCLEKLRAGDLTDNCDPKHTFMHVPVWDSTGIDRIRRGQVLVGEKEVPLQDWLRGIKKAWGFPVAEEDGVEKVESTEAVIAAA